MPKPMTDPQKDYIEKLADKHDLSDADLDDLAEEVTGFPGAQWKELNIGEASQLIDRILEEYGGFGN
jgi:hypothetical protein